MNITNFYHTTTTITPRIHCIPPYTLAPFKALRRFIFEKTYGYRQPGEYSSSNDVYVISSRLKRMQEINKRVCVFRIFLNKNLYFIAHKVEHNVCGSKKELIKEVVIIENSKTLCPRPFFSVPSSVKESRARLNKNY